MRTPAGVTDRKVRTMENTIQRRPLGRRATAAFALLLVALLLVLGATIAYFTDRATTEASVRAGVVDITSVLQLYGVAEDGVSLGDPVFGNAIEGWSPGDRYAANWTLANKGDKSARLSNTITLSVSKEGGFDASVTPESIASVVSLGAASVIDHDGQSIPVTLDYLGSVWNPATSCYDVTYRLSDVSIQGSAEFSLPEDGASGPLMFRADLGFDASAGSEYQGMVARLVNVTDAVQARGASGPVSDLMP